MLVVRTGQTDRAPAGLERKWKTAPGGFFVSRCKAGLPAAEKSRPALLREGGMTASRSSVRKRPQGCVSVHRIGRTLAAPMVDITTALHSRDRPSEGSVTANSYAPIEVCGWASTLRCLTDGVLMAAIARSVAVLLQFLSYGCEPNPHIAGLMGAAACN
jgi:hypothetical protein